VLCVLGPRRTTGLALWACSVVLFRVKWRAVSREEHVLGSTVRASVRGGQRKLGLPAETASSAQARSNSGVGFSCPDPVNEPSTLVILGKQGWFPDVGFRKQARKPTPPVNECHTGSEGVGKPISNPLFLLSRVGIPTLPSKIKSGVAPASTNFIEESNPSLDKPTPRCSSSAAFSSTHASSPGRARAERGCCSPFPL
jgi:hypothetical protein